MSLIRVMTVFAAANGLPEDSVVQNLHFATDDPATPDDLDDIETAVWNFYGGGAPRNLTQWLGTSLSRAANAVQLRSYVKEPGEEDFGSPSRISTRTMSAPLTAAELPREVAVCLSFRANLTDIPEEEGATRPAARRRGRIYFGPLNTDALSTGASLPSRPATNLVNDLAAAAAALEDAFLTSAARWVVAHAASSPGFTVFPVLDGWVDNAFDTQRRRGVAASARTLWS